MRLIIVTQEPEPRAFGVYRSWREAYRQADFLCLDLGVPSVIMDLDGPVVPPAPGASGRA
jgi:hypothetical protein